MNTNPSEEGSSSKDLPLSLWFGPRRTSGPVDTKATRALKEMDKSWLFISISSANGTDTNCTATRSTHKEVMPLCSGNQLRALAYQKIQNLCQAIDTRLSKERAKSMEGSTTEIGPKPCYSQSQNPSCTPQRLEGTKRTRCACPGQAEVPGPKQGTNKAGGLKL